MWRKQAVSTVVGNVRLCRDHHRLELRVGEFGATEAGQFVQLACREVGMGYVEDREVEWAEGEIPQFRGVELIERVALLRRAFSLAGRRETAGGVELEIIYRVVGVGTTWLSRVRRGDEVEVLGPLGNGFVMPGEEEVAVLVGGGVGIGPMLYLASRLAGRGAVAFCGAVTRELLPLTVTVDSSEAGDESIKPLYNIEEFSRHGIAAVISTDDGSYGFAGLVTEALQRYLEKWFEEDGSGLGVQSSEKKRRPVIYTCGPEGMMKRVGEIATSRGIRCQVSVERAMACGMGTCQSCCIGVRKAEANKPPLVGKEWGYKLACTDGPVFEAGELMW